MRAAIRESWLSDGAIFYPLGIGQLIGLIVYGDGVSQANYLCGLSLGVRPSPYSRGGFWCLGCKFLKTGP